MKNLCRIAQMLAVTSFIGSGLAQEVSIPDPGLNTAIRQALQKPAGPLTAQDLLTLTNLSAGGRAINNVEGLEGARNLSILDLDNNSITNFPITDTLTNLTILDLFGNHLAKFVLSNAAPRLTILDLAFNSAAQVSLPAGMTGLDTLFLEGNALTNVTLPAGLTALTQLDLTANSLTSVTLPTDMTNLVTALIFANQLTNLTVPPNLTRLASLDLDFNQLRNLDLPVGLTHLSSFVARDNHLTNLTFRADMTNLNFVDLGGNQLPNLTLPANLTQLSFLRLTDNKLTSFTLPPGLANLSGLFLQNNQLTNLSLASELNQLVQIDVRSNQLSTLTLPPGITNLTTLVLDGNPLTSLVLPEPLAETTLARTVATLRNQGIPVFTYPLAIQLLLPRQQPVDAFRFAITGPPGVYSVFGSTNLVTWSPIGPVTNPLGTVFSPVESNLSAHKFYRALLQGPPVTPVDMVFIPPNTFTLGSPVTEVGHQADESPQTTVTLSHGFWISKFLVTQRDYLAVIGSNPSGFPGDLDRPVESVSWLDATNYCAKLTERDLVAGRIPPGSHYELPTEAEWECAARAGTSTRFYYGDDPNVTSLTNHAWYSANSGFKPRPVGQKLPNALGLYDMAGNVWEWCQDWYGPYPGGSVTDPQGPASNAIGFKVIRGGAWEAFELDCRSARRSIEAVSPFITDFIIGFRVVLAVP